MKKPELLLPAGNAEAFFAALEGGADAIYLGLRNFNARDRAKNFTTNQLQSILKEAEKKDKKIYSGMVNKIIEQKKLTTNSPITPAPCVPGMPQAELINKC